MSFSFQRIGTIVHRMITETQVNPLTIYCQITGAPIGTLDREEFDLVLATIDDTMDDDVIVDELYIRTIMSMRPSPAWNYIQHSTLNKLRIADPIRLASYLLGRYYEPRDKAYDRLKRTIDQRVTDGINRIVSYVACESLISAPPEQVKQFVTLLLLIDSEFDLSEMSQFVDFPKTPVDFDVENLEKYVAALQSAYQAQIVKRDARARKQKLDSNFFERVGNRLTSDVATKAFMELKPLSATAMKTAKMNSLTNMIAAFMTGDDGVGHPIAPPPVNPNITRIEPLRLRLPTLAGGTK